jgi:tetratricopeptide (TPR) repeat protein
VNEPTDWTSAIAILTAGLALGLLFALFFAKRKSALPVIGNDSERKDLEAKRDVLVQRLRDLDESAQPEERARLEHETAEVLRKLDGMPPAGTVVETAHVPATMNPTIKGFLWGAGSFAALAGLFYLVTQASTPRQEGGTVTGNTPAMGQQQPAAQQGMPSTNPMVLQLEAAVQREPNNLQLRNDLAQAYLETDNLMAVFEQTKFVLEKSPTDSRALTFQALVRMAMGDAEEATKMLQQATRSDPKNLDAWVSLAWVYAQQKKMAEAEAMIAEAVKQSPNDRARLEDVFTQMKMQAAQPQQASAVPEGHPPIDGTPAPAATPAAASAGGRSITVTLDLDPAARSKSGVLYVMARNPMGGPPVAVKRLMVSSFPTTFTLGQADSMMGQPLPDKFRLEARLDSDGDAATKAPTDPTAMQNDVMVGANVKLALK